jgi:hypothetical protein
MYLGSLMLALAGVFAPSASSAVAAAMYVVDDGGGDCVPFTPTHVAIQIAINDAITNSVKTILVCPGMYDYFAVTGASKLTIKAAIPGTFPLVNAPATAPGHIAYVINSSSVVLDGLRFDGDTFPATLTIDVVGVQFENSSGTIQNSVVSDVSCFPTNCGHGYGIALIDENGDGKVSTLTIKNVNVADYDKTGIYARGQTKLNVSNSRVVKDAASTPLSIRGLWLSDGATGSIKSSTISNAGTGLYLLGAGKVTFSGNIVINAEYGMEIRATCDAYQQSASANKITGNKFAEIANYGVLISSDYAPCSHTDKNTISSNQFSTMAVGGSGIYFMVSPFAFADKNAITGNTFMGFSEIIHEDPETTNTKVSGNIWIPN